MNLIQNNTDSYFGRRTWHFIVCLLAWLSVALLTGYQRTLTRLPMPATQVFLVGCTVVLWVASRTSPGYKSWLSRLDPRWFASVHLVRFVGIYFIHLYHQGRLPFAFAVPGGIGDMLAATGALVLIACPPRNHARRRLWVAWNVFGLMDILFVVFTAARLGLADRESMAPLTYLPLSLLPTFFVPIIIASHIELFRRLRTTGYPAGHRLFVKLE